MAVKYFCDNCEAEVPESTVIAIAVHQSKNDETTESHSCIECFDLLLEGDASLAQTMLLG